MTLIPTHITTRILLMALATLALAFVACGSNETIVPTPAPAGPGTGPQTTEAAIERVREYLGEREFENINCLETLENAVSVEWSAVALTDANWAVTLRVDPHRLLFNVHSWNVDKREGRIESSRRTC
jgi:hypothetical protein